MPQLLLQDLPPDAIDTLTHHNLLLALARAEVIESAVKSIEISQEESDQQHKKYVEKLGISDENDLNEHLRSSGLDKSGLKWNLELPLRITRHSKNQFSNKAEARFLSKKETLDQIIYSLLRVKDAFLARELYLRIKNKEANFDDLAANFSQGPEAKSKGIIGPVSLKQAHPILSERLRTSKPGHLMEPFQVVDWWVVARLERYEPAKFDDRIATAMTQELFYEWVEEQAVCKIKEVNHGSTSSSS